MDQIPKDLEYFDKMKKIHINLLDYLDSEDDIEEKYQIINDIFQNQKIENNTVELKTLLKLITKLSNNHHRCKYFFEKIEKILLYFQNEMPKNFSNLELFHIFKSNKRVLLFLIKNEIIKFDQSIVEIIIQDEYLESQYPQYFHPEIKPFINEKWFPKYDENKEANKLVLEIQKEMPENFYEQRKIGENDNFICELIRKDSLADFIEYINKNNYQLDSTINSSIYETNNFLLKMKNEETTLIEYAAFFGSIQIFNYLTKNNVELKQSLWYYAIHGNNQCIIHFLDDKHIKPDDRTYQQCLIESIKCHHNDLATYIVSSHIKRKNFSHDVSFQMIKCFNFTFINKKIIKKYNINNFLDKNQDFQEENQIQVKRKRGRPKTKCVNDKVEIKSKVTKNKKVDNDEKLQNLDNPQLVSIPKKPFIISVSLKNKLTQEIIDSLMSNSKENEIDWKTFNIEEKFDHVSKNDENEAKYDDKEDNDENDEEDNGENEEDDNDEDEEDDNDDNEEEDNYEDDQPVVIKENNEYGPFSNELLAHTFISKANKGYRIHKIESNDPNIIYFDCCSKGCCYRAEFIRKDEGFYLLHQTHHSCPHPVLIPTKTIREVVFKHGKHDHLNEEYMTMINASLGLQPNTISKLRIRRAYNKVFKLDRKERLVSWGKLQSFIDIVKQAGGNGKINKDEKGCINFVGIVPNYAIRFMNSILFFPVVQCDTRFQNSISKGHLYTLVTLTGNRTILPLAMAWAPSENKIFTNMFLELIHDQLNLIKSCHTDESQALILPIENAGINNLLCTWHMSQHCPNKNTFISLVKSQTSQEYFYKKHEIIESKENLCTYLNQNSRFNKISRFESEVPRDQYITSSAVESLNATVKRLNLKKAEPLEVFINIYDIGFFALKDICLQREILTDSVHEWLSYALTISNHLTVKQSPISHYKFEVSKENDENTKCTVIIIPLENPTCSCKFYSDCGMVCIHILAVASKFNMDWSSWIHPRYYVSNYKIHFQNSLFYPDFDRIIKVNDDIPVKIVSLRQKQNRIRNPSEKSLLHKH